MEQPYRQQDDDWLTRRTGARRGEADMDIDGLREDIEAYPAQPGSWEAACLKSIASLLESLEQARAEQETLTGRLADTRVRLAETEAKRDDLEVRVTELDATDRATREIEQERDDILDSLGNATVELAEAQEERRAAVERAAAQLEEQRQQDEQQEAELTGLREKLARMEVEREEWDAALERVRSGQQDLDETRERLAKTERERDALAENVRDIAPLRQKVELLREECVELEHAREESLVETCDLRVRVNRLEHDIEEERDQRRRKVKKILAKIHGELDEAGAPRGDDLSFGERVRWLRRQIDDR